MLNMWGDYKIVVSAKHLPESCTACPFWSIDMNTLESGACLLTGTEILADGPQDEKRMDDCAIIERNGQ